jgi:hypothetical protein
MKIGNLMPHHLGGFGRGGGASAPKVGAWRWNKMQWNVTEQNGMEGCPDGEDMGHWPLREPMPKREAGEWVTGLAQERETG